MSQYFTLLLPLITLGAGALLQHYLSKSSHKSEEATLRQQQAYVDYLSASVGAKFSGRNSSKENLSKLIDAKLRIAIYGSSAVVSKLAQFERAGANLNNKTSIGNYLKMISEMRTSSGNENSSHPESSLKTVLFGPEESD